MRVSSREPLAPPRPHLPPVLLAGLAFWAAGALVHPFLRNVGAEGCVALGAAAMAAGVTAGAVCVRRRVVPLAAVAALGVAAALVACAAAAWSLTAAASMAGGERLWECTLTTDARQSDFGATATARAASDGRVIAVRLNLPAEAGGLMQGERFTVRAALGAPSAAATESFWNSGLAGSLTVRDLPAPEERRGALLAGLRRHAIGLIERYGGEDAPLVQALVCGWRGPMEESGAYEQFKRVGLAHLVAVSGAHLSIVTLFVTSGLRLVRLGRRAIAVVTALFLVGYVGFTGMPVSALRAASMAATGLLALLTDRRSSALAALGLCLIVFGAADVSALLSPSFVLSAGSTLGIVVLAPLFTSWAARARPAVAAASAPLALTAASALATQPYAAALFAQVPLLSPVANMVGAPLFTVACVTGFAAVLAACLVPAVAPLSLGAAGAAAAPLAWAVRGLAAVPGTCLPVDGDAAAMVLLSVVMVAGLWAWWPSPSGRSLAAAAGALATAALLAAAPWRAGADEIVMLDVGQGDAFLVRSQGAALLVDTGNRDALLKEACARQGVRFLDRVAVTHPDDDHCGSLEALGDVAAVEGLLVADDLLECPCEGCGDLRDRAESERYTAGVRGLKVGDAVTCGRFTLTVVWPASFADEGGNGDSLSFLCSYDGDGDGAAEWTALLCGDAEAEQLRAMAPSLPADGIDVLKVGHHGSKKSLDESLVARLAPRIALVSVGAGNRYGHPAPEVCDLLAEGGCTVLRTDEAGDVAVAFSMEKIEVSTEHAAPSS